MTRGNYWEVIYTGSSDWFQSYMACSYQASSLSLCGAWLHGASKPACLLDLWATKSISGPKVHCWLPGPEKAQATRKAKYGQAQLMSMLLLLPCLSDS